MTQGLGLPVENTLFLATMTIEIRRLQRLGRSDGGCLRQREMSLPFKKHVDPGMCIVQLTYPEGQSVDSMIRWLRWTQHSKSESLYPRRLSQVLEWCSLALDP